MIDIIFLSLFSGIALIFFVLIFSIYLIVLYLVESIKMIKENVIDYKGIGNIFFIFFFLISILFLVLFTILNTYLIYLLFQFIFVILSDNTNQMELINLNYSLYIVSFLFILTIYFMSFFSFKHNRFFSEYRKISSYELILQSKSLSLVMNILYILITFFLISTAIMMIEKTFSNRVTIQIILMILSTILFLFISLYIFIYKEQIIIVNNEIIYEKLFLTKLINQKSFAKVNFFLTLSNNLIELSFIKKYHLSANSTSDNDIKITFKIRHYSRSDAQIIQKDIDQMKEFQIKVDDYLEKFIKEKSKPQVFRGFGKWEY